MTVRRKSPLLVASLVLGLLALAPCAAQADKVHLVGGSVIEGKVVREADKVTVELASGSLSLDARSVLRIEPSESPLQLLAARRAALPPVADLVDAPSRRKAIAVRLALANAYRHEGALAEERALLEEILELDSDHARARQRLGFVRTEQGWVDGHAQLLAHGFVKRDGVWLSPAQSSQQATAELQRQTAELIRQKAALELEAKRAELDAEKTVQHQDEPVVQVYPWPLPLAARRTTFGAAPWQPSLERPFTPAPTPFINGVRPPSSYFP